MTDIIDFHPDINLELLALRLGILAGAVVAALLLHTLLFWVLRKTARHTDTRTDESILTRLRAPTRLAAVLGATHVVTSIYGLAFSELARNVVSHVFFAAWTVCIAWLGIRLVYGVEDVLLSRYDLNATDNLRARKIHTQVQVFNKVFYVVVVIVALGSILMSFERFHQLGTSLLASAGVAGIVIGLAAQKTIGNVFAGIQLAFTQPIRIDDVVIVEGEWGRIEEITFTYVVVRIWDKRRLVLPVSYFLEKPFENWTRKSADLLGTVYLYTDYTVPVAKVEEELKNVVKETDLWDGQVALVQVTEASDRSVQLRALVSAQDAAALWDLRCLVRRRLVDFLQREHPTALPRHRAELNEYQYDGSGGEAELTASEEGESGAGSITEGESPAEEEQKRDPGRRMERQQGGEE
jgi:small-conductance mechanosensitive channel